MATRIIRPSRDRRADSTRTPESKAAAQSRRAARIARYSVAPLDTAALALELSKVAR